jgi:hypothetical protein
MLAIHMNARDTGFCLVSYWRLLVNARQGDVFLYNLKGMFLSPQINEDQSNTVFQDRAWVLLLTFRSTAYGTEAKQRL